ncbi:hypothetical protein [Haloimpatiens massiliensis]|uniref:hypothetical protein n=1 Tax=Haloimpatiens massiliensis TaxID=1658110 RepID=UPI000C858756|nr:hypothetical protein [Haloimpatiens massiliensis]
MKIAIVGSNDSVDKVYKIGRKFYKEHQFIHFIVNSTDQCNDVLDLCEEQADGIIFTGLGFVKVINESKKITKPHFFISRDGTSIMKAFWNIKRKGLNPKNISIDVVDEYLLKDICEEFQFEFKDMYIYPFDSDKKEAVYKENHRELWKNGKIDLVITSYGWIYNELKKENIPVERLEITNPLIRHSIDYIIYKIKNNTAKKSQIATQIVDVDIKQDSKRYQYEVLKKIIFVENQLVDYISTIQGTMFRSGDTQFTIVSTRGAIENGVTEQFFLNILSSSKKENIELYTGIGFGNTAYDADFNARIALAKSKELKESAYFIVDDEKNVIGPIGNKEMFYYKSIVLDEAINKIAKDTGISTTYLSKIYYLMKNTNTEYLDSKSLSELLLITDRSARRILKKLVDANYGEIVTSTQPNSVGRPMNIFKINIPL